MILKCEYIKCQKDFEPTRKRQKYCSKSCQTKSSSYRTYHKMKDEPAFKEMKKRVFYNWLSRNKDKFIVDVNARQKKIMDTRKELGLCYICGIKHMEDGRKSCLDCRMKRRVTHG